VNEQLPGHQLYGVRAAYRLTDGRIAIVNGGSSEIRYFSARGDFVSSTGGHGQGPAEFNQITSIHRGAGDSLTVLTFDPAIAWIAPDGKVVRKIPIEWIRLQCRFDENPSILADGTLLIKGEDNFGISGCPPLSPDVNQTTDLLARAHPTTGTIDTLAILPGTDRDGRRYALFGRMLITAIAPDRIFAGESGGDSIGVWTYTGDQVATFRIPHQAIPVPESIKTQEPQRRPTPDDRIVMQRPYVPDHYPRFGRLMADRAGNLWVMDYPQLTDRTISGDDLTTPRPGFVDAAGAMWTVLTPDGDVVATVRTPPGLFVLEIGTDYVLGVAYDDLDVESVRLYTLDRS
jgi:hypothetical protein